MASSVVRLRSHRASPIPRSGRSLSARSTSRVVRRIVPSSEQTRNDT